MMWASLITRQMVAAGVAVVATLVATATANSEELLRGKENCLRHDDFPSPNECCSKPQWINRYAVRRCRYVHAEVDGSRYERGSCEARCGLFKINMTMTDRIQRVRIFRPRLQTRGVEPAWINVVLKALSYCKPKVTQLQGRRVRDDEEMEQCEIAEDIFGDCLQAQMFMHCPRTTWIESGTCDSMRELIAAGCPYKTLGEVVVLNDEGYVRDDRTLDDEYDRPYPGMTESPRYDDDYDSYDRRQPNYPTRAGVRRGNGLRKPNTKRTPKCLPPKSVVPVLFVEPNNPEMRLHVREDQRGEVFTGKFRI